MNVSEMKKGKNSVILLKGEMVVQYINDIKSEIMKYFTNARDMELDLSQVEKIDTSGFQLLISIRKGLEKNKKNLKLVKPSDDVKRIFKLYQEEL